MDSIDPAIIGPPEGYMTHEEYVALQRQQVAQALEFDQIMGDHQDPELDQIMGVPQDLEFDQHLEVSPNQQVAQHQGAAQYQVAVQHQGAAQHQGVHQGQGNHSVICYHSTPPDGNHTCNHPYHAGYSEGHLPTLLFMLEKPILNDEEEVQALQENGQVAMSISGKPIRDFPFLPRYIATNAPAWLLEYWFRTDSRLKYNDILMRMAIPLEKWPSMVSYINTVRNRFRNMLGLSSWASHQGAIKLAEVELVDRWTYEQIYLNTTMVIEYGTQAGGVSTVPQYLRSKMLLSGVPRYYNVGTFCGNGESFRPSDRMERTMDLLIQLKRKAQQLGLATWQLVPPGNDIPMSWAVVDKPRMFSRVVTQKFDNNLVLPDWRTMSRMSKETWQPIFGNGAQEDNGVTGDEQPEDV